MSALRPARRDEERHDATEHALPPQDSPDWLSLQQAACEMGVSMSTVRRMVSGGRLLNRMIPHRGGFATSSSSPAPATAHRSSTSRSAAASGS